MVAGLTHDVPICQELSSILANEAGEIISRQLVINTYSTEVGLMIINKGENIHVVVRRNFELEIRRHFLGQVHAVDGSVVRLIGYSTIFDRAKNMFIQGAGIRTTIMDLAESGYIVNIIPAEVDISALKYAYDTHKKLILTDGKTFTLDINEFGVNR